jgi:hypothetical protein
MRQQAVVGLVFLAACPWVAWGQVVTCGDFRVNDATAGPQRFPAVASSLSSFNYGFVVAWESSGITDGIFARRFDAAGAPLGPDLLVINVAGHHPAVAMAASGEFMVVWEQGSSIWGRRFNRDGDPLGGLSVVGSSIDGVAHPSVAALFPQRFVVAWTSFDSPTHSAVFGRLYNDVGVPEGVPFQLHPDTARSQANPSVVEKGGSFLVVWQDNDPAQGWPLLGRIFSPTGVPGGAPFPISSPAVFPAQARAAVHTGAGDFVVVWPRDEPSGRRIAARAFLSTGDPQGPAFLVSPVTSSVQDHPSIAQVHDDGYAVVWHDSAGEDRVVGRRLDPAGAPIGPEFVVNQATAGPQANPAVAKGSDGRHISVWESADADASGIFGQIDCSARFFFATLPCRVVDTRQPPGNPLLANTLRYFSLEGCNLPSSARAVALNVTAVNPTDRGNLRLLPAGDPVTMASALNFTAGRTRANNAIVARGLDGQVAVQCDMPAGSTGTTHLVLDVYGYFKQ